MHNLKPGSFVPTALSWKALLYVFHHQMPPDSEMKYTWAWNIYFDFHLVVCNSLKCQQGHHIISDSIN